jgi:two-component system response regulator DevR
MPITVLLTDDKEVVRHSIQLLLGSEPEIRIVGEATTFQQTLQRGTALNRRLS